MTTTLKPKKSVTWKVILSPEGTAQATMEIVNGFPKDTIESHYILMGMLDNLKSLHQRKIEILQTKNISGEMPKKEDDLED